MTSSRRDRVLWSVAGLSLVVVCVFFVWVRAIGPLPGELRFLAWRSEARIPDTLIEPLRFVTSLGNTWVAVTTVLVLVAVCAEACGRHPVGLILGAASVVAFAEVLRAVLGPTSQAYRGAVGANTGTGANFPSVHSAYAVSVLGVACWLALSRRKRAMSCALALPALLMGPALLLQGAHYPADVLAGYALGLAWLIGVVLLGERWARSA